MTIKEFKEMFSDDERIVFVQEPKIDKDGNVCLDSNFYGGVVVEIKVTSKASLLVEAVGVVSATLFDRKNNGILQDVYDDYHGGSFYTEMDQVTQSNMFELEVQGELVFQNQNWFEVNGMMYEKDDGVGEYVNLADLFDNFVSCSLDNAIGDALSLMVELRRVLDELMSEK